ncbi:MAG: cytochrome d ubiquinol oxidase subunit II [Candidatus Caenarcaniphilales bacterium]|nr:cytochrome d ubiquinol oxidase subunit II [Candidatus Caenarcaniphilales bacterium]
MNHLNLNLTWFIIVGVLFTGYVILDGFDLGVGALHLFSKGDHERRLMINSIGPVWDGNEVWLVTGGGATFAAFPEIYASVFSGFYLAFMLLLLSLIFRAVAIEFRSKFKAKWARQFWDISFSISSISSALLIGVSIGNIIWGVEFSKQKILSMSFLDLVNPYSLSTGILTLALFMMHGSIYLVLKNEGELQKKARRWFHYSMVFFSLSFIFVSVITLLYIPHINEHFKENVIWLLLPFTGILAIANIPREIYHGREFGAFLSSCFAIAALTSLVGIGLFPEIIHCSNNPKWTMDIYNSSSSQKTLAIMLNIALIGVPLVLAYTSCIYYVFRGKVKITKDSY